jgi:hypothetical protein
MHVIPLWDASQPGQSHKFVATFVLRHLPVSYLVELYSRVQMLRSWITRCTAPAIRSCWRICAA